MKRSISISPRFMHPVSSNGRIPRNNDSQNHCGQAISRSHDCWLPDLTTRLSTRNPVVIPNRRRLPIFKSPALMQYGSSIILSGILYYFGFRGTEMKYTDRILASFPHCSSDHSRNQNTYRWSWHPCLAT